MKLDRSWGKDRDKDKPKSKHCTWVGRGLLRVARGERAAMKGNKLPAEEEPKECGVRAPDAEAAQGTARSWGSDCSGPGGPWKYWGHHSVKDMTFLTTMPHFRNEHRIPFNVNCN